MMYNRPKVSILVPIYNAQEYLQQCLDSIISQTLREIEIICINDGSTDNSLSIIKKYQRKDERINIIDKSNTGYGDSMNQGISSAKGEYIGIVESDDFISSSMFELLYNKAKEHNAEIVKGNYYCYQGNNEIQVAEYLSKLPYNTVLNEKERNELILCTPAIWCGIYKKEFLEKKKIKFLPTPGASYQDLGFSYKTVLSAEKVILIKDSVLYYRIDNINSSVKDINKVFCICDEFAEMEKYLKENIKNPNWYVFVKNKYKRYCWNLNRLSGVSRNRFLIKMSLEMREASLKGWIDKEYWNDKEWQEVHTLIYNICEYDRRKNSCIFCIDVLKDIGAIYIYGAGKRCENIIDYLLNTDINVKAIVVSDLENNKKEIRGIKVIHIDEVLSLDKNTTILISVAEPISSEISSFLYEKGVNSHLKIYDDLYYFMISNNN